MAKDQKSRVSKLRNTSPNVKPLQGFESAFDKNVDKNNKWLKVVQLILWDTITNIITAKLKNHRVIHIVKWPLTAPFLLDRSFMQTFLIKTNQPIKPIKISYNLNGVLRFGTQRNCAPT